MLNPNDLSGSGCSSSLLPAASESEQVARRYISHTQQKLKRYQGLMKEAGYQAVVIASGSFKTRFADDLFYPFKASPYFTEWLPLTKRRNAYLVISADMDKPTLWLDGAEDIWHTEPEALPEAFAKAFYINEFSSLTTLQSYIESVQSQTSKVALIAECNALALAEADWNPAVILNAVNYYRRYKTDYEHTCIRQANRLAAPAHQAAATAFLAGASEYEIAAAYLQACQCTENDMPYSIIAGINEHAAVLHHHDLNKQRPARPLSFLLDAGVEVNGYASDITRTYAVDSGSDFAAMISLLDKKQQQLVAAGAIDKSPVDLHRLSHRAIAEILVEFGVFNVSVETALASGIVETFYPHGLGHHLGVNVHDKGGHLANAQGEPLPAVKAYPKLRHTAPMVASQVYTVEPGLYFIPAHLKALRNSKNASQINWPAVEGFMPYGGIRIEDNIILHQDGRLENLTRDAFLALT